MTPLPYPTPIYVTKPSLPPLEKFEKHIHEIWATKTLSNQGPKHDQLQDNLRQLLHASNLKLFCNGTLALTLAIQALGIRGEILTTPFTFPATVHSIKLAGAQPVFCDINTDTMCIDPLSIERMIGPNTEAILGVHVYGMPCAVEEIEYIAAKYKLKVIYDGAHAFMTSINGVPISDFGDITMFSFHATKLFHTIEGGCLTFRDNGISRKLELLRNFGIEDEQTVNSIGTNAKLNEFQAAMGLEMLSILNEERKSRETIKKRYIEVLSEIPGIEVFRLPNNVDDSLQYFVIRVNKLDYGLSRDELYQELKNWNIFSRKYFYPICSNFSCYLDVRRDDLTNANFSAEKVLCLPFFGDLEHKAVEHICNVIKYLQRNASIRY